MILDVIGFYDTVLSDFGNQTDIFTLICQYDIKAEILSEVISYILHVLIFTLFVIWISIKRLLH